MLVVTLCHFILLLYEVYLVDEPHLDSEVCSERPRYPQYLLVRKLLEVDARIVHNEGTCGTKVIFTLHTLESLGFQIWQI